MENQEVVLRIHVVPGSKMNKVVGVMDDGSLKIRIRTKPINGKANKALIHFLAEELHKKESDLILISGQTSRNKRIKIFGMDSETLSRRLTEIIH